MKILIAEDDPMTAEGLMLDIKTLFNGNMPLEFLGPVASVTEARQVLRNGKDLDLAILDIGLQDGEDGGIKLANLVSGIARVPIIFVSGMPRDKGFELAKMSRPFGYLKKPYDRQELCDAVELATQYNPPGHYWFNRKADIEQELLYLKTAVNEITPVRVKDIVLVEADDKILNFYMENPYKKIFINSPGLKNFFSDKLSQFQIFCQVNKKYVVNSQRIRKIKDNHIHMQLEEMSNEEAEKKGFPKPIPLPSDPQTRKVLLGDLGIS